MMEVKNNCDHPTVMRSEGGPPHVWACQHCGQEFLPTWAAAGVQSLDQGAYDTALDAVAGVMEAVIWGITERAVEKYGQEVAMGTALDDEGEQVKQCNQHVWIKDKCTICGAPKFLGASDVR